MEHLEHIWKKGKKFLGVKTPIIAGAMTWISDSQFVADVSNAGAFGCLAAGNMDPAMLDSEIKKTQKLTKNPFAVNLITIAPHYKNHLKIAAENKVPYIVFAGSFPRQPEIKTAKARNAISTPQIGSELRIVAVRALKNRGHDEFSDLQMDLIQKRRKDEISLAEAQYEVEKFWMGALRKAVIDGDVDFGSVMAGQSVGLVDKIRPLKDALVILIEEAEQELSKILESCKKS